MDSLQSQNNTSNRLSGPSNLTSRIVKMIPDPTNILMNPATFPIILVCILLMYHDYSNGLFLYKYVYHRTYYSSHLVS